VTAATSGVTKGRVYLIGSMQGGTGADMIDTALGALLAQGKRTLNVAVSYAAIAENQDALEFMSKRLPALFESSVPGTVVTRFTLPGEPGAGEVADARRIVEAADFVFLGGGDPVAGARIFRESGADAWLRAARVRGTSLGGVSAGAILLGAWWATWPTAETDAPFAGGELVPCTQVVSDLVLDCQDEEGEWGELKMVAAMLEDRGETVRLLGIPSGGGVIVLPGGELEIVGEDPVRFGESAGGVL
jgi:hypothetical protein